MGNAFDLDRGEAFQPYFLLKDVSPFIGQSDANETGLNFSGHFRTNREVKGSIAWLFTMIGDCLVDFLEGPAGEG